MNWVCLAGFTSGVTCAPTGSMAPVSASRRRRPRSWRTLCAVTVSVVRRETAARSSTASAGHLMTNHSTAFYTPRSSEADLRCGLALEFVVDHLSNPPPQVLHRLRSLPELVPRALRGHSAERGQSHRLVRLSAVSVDRGRHDSPVATH